MAATITSSIRRTYIRKRSVLCRPEHVEGTDCHFDAEGIAQTAHCALWRAHVCAHYDSPAANIATKALVKWVHEHRTYPVGDNPKSADLDIDADDLAAVNTMLGQLVEDRWLSVTAGRLPELLMRKRQPQWPPSK